MKKLILIFLLALIIVPATTWAQQPTSKEPVKIIELKRNFFKDSLKIRDIDLSHVFWNKFDVFENREAVFHEEFKKDMESHGIDLRKNTKLTKEQSVYVIKKKLEMKEKILGLDQERFDAYEKILPAEDLIRYFDLDQKFKTEMTKKFEAAKQIQKSNDTQSLQITTPASTIKSTNIDAHPQQK